MSPPNIQNLIDKYREFKNSSDSRKLQTAIWLNALVKATGESKYTMEAYLSGLLPGDERRVAADRIRYLRNVTEGYKPSKNHPLRGLDIVERLHEHYGHPEIKCWFYSLFWHVISSDFFSYASRPEEIRRILAECIEIARHNGEILGYTARPSIRYFEFEEPLRVDRRNPAKKKIRIPSLLLYPASFDQLAVLAVMFREAYIGCSIGYAAQIRLLFLEKLHELLKNPFIEEKSIKQDLFDLVIKRVLCPIRQNMRNRAKDLESSYKAITSPSDRSEEIMSFLRSHDKSIKYP